MRSKTSAEQAFVAQIVDNTQKLVSNDSVGLHVKLATIKRAISRNSKELAVLRQKRAQAEEPESNRHMERLIALRERATRYLVETAEFLVHRERFGPILRQGPRTFAFPTWEDGTAENES